MPQIVNTFAIQSDDDGYRNCLFQEMLHISYVTRLDFVDALLKN